MTSPRDEIATSSAAGDAVVDPDVLGAANHDPCGGPHPSNPTRTQSASPATHPARLGSIPVRVHHAWHKPPRRMTAEQPNAGARHRSDDWFTLR